MRLTPLFLFFAVAVIAAGCASQPVRYAQVAPVAPAGSNGIDGVVYGSAGTQTPAAYPSGYAARYSAPYAAAPAYVRGYPAPVATAYQSTGPALMPGATYAYVPGATTIAPPSTQSAYTLDAGDRLRVVVFGQDGLTNSYSVDASGHIAMPLIGSVAARGETTDGLAARIADKLRDGYVRDPHVAVEIEAYRPFFILGEVTAPGQYPYVANMTAETAVAIAGGFGPRAYRETVILNRNYNGQPVRVTVPLTYPLRPGDTINVQERWF